MMSEYNQYVPKHIQNELIRCRLMEEALKQKQEPIKEVPKIIDDVEDFVYDDDNFSY